MDPRLTCVRPPGIAAVFAAAILVALASTSARAHWDYEALMSGQEMVPPTSSPAEGHFHGTFPGHTQCPAERDVLMISLSVEDLQGSPTAASLWIGEEGQIGEVFARFPLDETEVPFTRDECWNLDGHMYVVIETDLHPLGEIRGQIIMWESMPVAERSWGAVKHVYR